MRAFAPLLPATAVDLQPSALFLSPSPWYRRRDGQALASTPPSFARVRLRWPLVPSPRFALPPRLLPVALRSARCARALPRFIDHLLRISVRLGQDLGITLFRVGELLFDFLRIQQTFGDSLSPLFQDTEDRLVGKAAQQ